MQIYNTLTAKLADLPELGDKALNLYVCGVTVYDKCHIGHARAMVVFDAFVRFLRAQGYEVNYVRNITDIDDKIIKRAHENNMPWQELTSSMIEKMRQDLQALGLDAPDHEPQATEFIPEMIAMIETLQQKGFAYVADSGDVCFSVREFPDYGKLSHRKLDDLIAGARVAVEAGKRDPADFVLWKLAKPGEPAWDSPWGAGRPGWHIECSAMVEKLLGVADIHGGGMDLKFPHHENEIAQSEGCCDKQHVKNWMHIGLVQVDDEKMSKSLNNFITIEQALNENSAEVLRYLLLSSHYRSPVNYSPDQINIAQQALMRLYGALDGLDLEVEPADIKIEAQKFNAALNDDFNTPEALAICFNLVREINKHKAVSVQKAASIAKSLKELLKPLNLLQQDIKSFLQATRLDEDKINKLINERNIARKSKDWAKSDQIRDELLAMGVELLDNADGTNWRAR